MNIKDIPQVEQTGDMLKAIFMRQQELEDKYNVIEKNNGAMIPELPVDLNTFHGQQRQRDIIYRITEELYEAGNCLRNKAWKTSQVPCDSDHYKEELADALHFFVQLFLEMGLTAEDVCNLYFRKSEVNKFRQESKY